MLTWSSWLAEVGRLSTLAGCASDLFSDASAAAVTCAIMKPEFRPGSARQERRQARHDGVDQHRDAPLGDRADLGDRDAPAHRRRARPARRGSCRRTGSRPRRRCPANTSGLSVTALASRTSTSAAWRSWSRQAPMTCGWQRRLYGSCTRSSCSQVRARGSRCRRAARGSRGARRSAPAGRARRGCAGRTAPSLPRAASTRQRADDQRRFEQPARSASSACSASAVETCVPLISARPSLAASVERREAGSRQRLARPARAGRRRSISPSPISAQRQVGERRQVARGADRALRTGRTA